MISQSLITLILLMVLRIAQSAGLWSLKNLMEKASKEASMARLVLVVQMEMRSFR